MASLELTSDYLFSMLASQSACKGIDMHDSTFTASADGWISACSSLTTQMS